MQQAGEQVQTQVKELERMQKEIERLKETSGSATEQADNNIRIAQLEREVLQVRQNIDTTLEIAEQEVKQVRIGWQAAANSNLLQCNTSANEGMNRAVLNRLSWLRKTASGRRMGRHMRLALTSKVR